MDRNAVGIDVGASYASVAYVDSRGQMRVVTHRSGQQRIPSALFFEDQSIVIGQEAVNLASAYPNQVAQFFKRDLGSGKSYEYLGKPYSAETLCALVISKLLRAAQEEIGAAVSSAVLTVPDCYDEKRRTAMERAANVADLKSVVIVNESLAVLLASGLLEAETERTCLLYHLGASSFHAVITRLSKGHAREIAVTGSLQLGGREWTNALVDYVAEIVTEHEGTDPRNDSASRQQLRTTCEQGKRSLSYTNRAVITFVHQGRHYDCEVTRDHFESLTRPLVSATEMLVGQCLSDANCSVDEIDTIILSGGASEMPMVRQMLRRFSGGEPQMPTALEHAAAIGAALFAHSRDWDDSEDSDDVPLAEVNMSRVNPHGIGILATDGRNRVNVVLIPRNSPLPTSITKVFRTNRDNAETLRITVTEGDSANRDDVEILGVYLLGPLPKGLRKGTPIELTIGYTANGRVKLSASVESQQVHAELSTQAEASTTEHEYSFASMLALAGLEGASGGPDRESPGWSALPGGARKSEEGQMEERARSEYTTHEPNRTGYGVDASGADEVDVNQGDPSFQFAAFYPERQPANTVGRIVACAYLPSVAPDDLVTEASKQLDLPPNVDLKVGAAEPNRPVTRHGALRVTVEVPGLLFDAKVASMSLWEDKQFVEFRFKPEADTPGSLVSGFVHFWLDGVTLLASIGVKILICEDHIPEEFRDAIARQNTRPYRSVFPSYSRLDREVVERLEAYAASFGDEYFRDVHKLRSGQEWSPELLRLIRRADVFQLFWSPNSASSTEVKREWECALQERKTRPDPFFVRPVYWADEPVPPPPDDLRGLQFAWLPIMNS